tara:strand:- start:9619 stop:9915 length:297 start_codon:yes stop_codon:yes gene_type:complete
MAKIKYKGKDKEIKLDNRAMMKFELDGGSMAEFETHPISASIRLACACLNLEGDPLDHANHLPALKELPEVMQAVIKEAGFTQGEEEESEDEVKKGNG